MQNKIITSHSRKIILVKQNFLKRTSKLILKEALINWQYLITQNQILLSLFCLKEKIARHHYRWNIKIKGPSLKNRLFKKALSKSCVQTQTKMMIMIAVALNRYKYLTVDHQTKKGTILECNLICNQQYMILAGYSIIATKKAI